MNNVTEHALMADLARLKGAHNNLATKVQDDLNQFSVAIKQCAAEITKIQGQIAAIENALRTRAAAPATSAPPAARRPAPPAVAPAPPQPILVTPASWPVDGEEDADLVE